MGAKTWMLVYADSNAREALMAQPPLDRDRTIKLANKLFPAEKLEAIGDGDLYDTSPPDDEVFVGCFPGISIVAAKEFGIDYPSHLQQSFITAGSSGKIYLHAMHSVVDWFAYALWVNGRLIRSLSLAPESGLLEDIGESLPFERPYRSGENPAIIEEGESYPFPFHPLDLAEAALKELFGYELEGGCGLLELESIRLVHYKR